MALAERPSVNRNPVISVCIANYNGMAVVAACIESVLSQNPSVTREILVYDDASTDGSADMIARRYPQARLLRGDVNRGYCHANNCMAEAARGVYLLLLNNDAALYPDALETFLKEAEAGARPAVLTLPQYDAETGRLLDMGSLLDPFLNPIPNLDPDRSEVGLAMGACLWIPRDLWRALGGFPEWFGSIAEDLLLCCRARLAGCAVRVVPRSGFLHHVGGSFGGGKVRGNHLITSRRRRALSERNKSFVMAVCYPDVSLALLPVHLLALVVEGGLLSLLKRDRSLFREIYWPVMSALWANRVRLWQLRSQVQANRSISVRDFFRVFRWFPHKLRMLSRHGLPEIR